MKHFVISLLIVPSLFAAISCNNSRGGANKGENSSAKDSSTVVAEVQEVAASKAAEEIDVVEEELFKYERERLAAEYDMIMQAWLDATNANLQTKAPQKFALYNVDEDGNPELYLRNDDEEIGLVLCCGGGVYTPAMTEAYNDMIRISDNRLYNEQFARGGFVLRSGIELSGSWFYTRFFCQQNIKWNPETGEDDVILSYYCDNEEPDAEERSMEFFAKIKEGSAPAALRSVVKWENISYLKQGIPDPNPTKMENED